eukprot:TRINITY_DN26993_c0_g1_i1.p1 TRINITY_DN26993_c0_g1~~TRINITY_DN26993_c0_g1_i1.p1  ORF type:complete len:1759 (+),score=157.69 TRINITY_DN26993_c0_g1_i1:43-5319(+)
MTGFWAQVWAILWYKDLLRHLRAWFSTFWAVFSPLLAALFMTASVYWSFWAVGLPDYKARPVPKFWLHNSTVFYTASTGQPWTVNASVTSTEGQLATSILTKMTSLQKYNHTKANMKNDKKPRWFNSVHEMEHSFFKPHSMDQACDVAVYFNFTSTGVLSYRIRTGGMPSTDHTRQSMQIYTGSPGENYASEGSLDVQNLLHQVLMSEYTGWQYQAGNTSLLFQRYPVKDGVKVDSFKNQAAAASAQVTAKAIGGMVSFAFFLAFIGITSSIVREKEYQHRQALAMAGVSRNAYFMTWLLNSLILHTAPAFVTLLTFKYWGIYYSASLGVLAIGALASVLANTCMAFAFSALFSQARSVPLFALITYLWTLGIGVWLANCSKCSLSLKQAVCLFPAAGHAMYIQKTVQLELSGGLNFGNMSQGSDLPSVLTIYLLLIVSCVLYWALAWYLEQVVPSSLGIHRPFYFLFTASYWRQLADSRRRKRLAAAGGGFGDTFEDEGHGLLAEHVAPGDVEEVSGVPVAVDIRGLRKQFGDFVAVRGLDLKLYEGQVLSLLGHNGAGKTTTISMLTGLIPATAGDAFYFGKSLAANFEHVLGEIGICPQKDVIFDGLTVAEHLRLFSALKGVPITKVKDVVDGALTNVGLRTKRNDYASCLSGGQKRKLMVAIAFSGNAKVVFLDEPTSGMDPVSRRAIWEVIEKNKEGRAIVLTTHFMDEADLLGDRIAVLQHGSLRCVGSSLFLKAKFGVGYTLTLVRQPGADANRLLEFVRSHIPPAAITSDAGQEVSMQLPLSYSKAFAQLFAAIDGKIGDLGVTSYGLSLTSLEEVFLRLSDEAPPLTDAPTGEMADRDSPLPGSPSNGKRIIPAGIETRASARSWVSQVRGLILKRMYVTKRDRIALIYQLAFPFMFLMTGMILYQVMVKNIHMGNTDIARLEAIDLVANATSPAQLPANAFIGLDTKDTQMTDTLKKIFAVPVDPGMKWILQANVDNKTLLNELKPGASTLSGGALWIGEALNQSIPYTFNFNQMIQYYNASIIRSIPDMNLQVFRQFFKYSTINMPQGHKAPALPVTAVNGTMQALPVSVAATQSFAALAFSVFLVIAMAFVPSSYASFIVKEREKNATFLQLVSGTPKLLYWATSLLWDTVLSAVYVGVVVGIFAAFQYHKMKDALGILFYFYLIYCIASTLLTYNLSLMFKKYSKAQPGIAAMLCFPGLIGVLADVSVGASTGPAGIAHQIVETVFAGIMPIFSAVKAPELALDVMFEKSMIMAKYNPKSYWDWVLYGRYLNIMYMQIAAYTILLVLFQTEWTALFRTMFRCCTKVRMAEAVPDLDDDVAKERERIRNNPFSTQAGGSADAPFERQEEWVRAANLYKKFGKKVAVNGLCVGIDKGECFGLLGANGAGKTTSIRMMTGETASTHGTGYICGQDVSGSGIYKLIGLCPQFDALLGELTARETLRVYSLLKGIPTDQIEATIQAFIDMVDLVKYADRPCGGYSGGNKRKLSLAVALLGHPPVIFLDEPSTGMDPKARRFMWDLITAITENHAVVMTSHSMEEVDALCNRLCIMTKGQMRCLGTPQHLKNKFGKGYTVEITLGNPEGSDQILDFMSAEFPGYKLVEHHLARMTFELPGNQKLSNIFAIIEANKSALDIQDYGVSQTTLEQVFVGIVQGDELEAQQAEEEEARRKRQSGCARCCGVCCWAMCCCGCCKCCICCKGCCCRCCFSKCCCSNCCRDKAWDIDQDEDTVIMPSGDASVVADLPV